MEFVEMLHNASVDLVEKSLDKRSVRPRMLPSDTFIARSAMQKAIRRGDRELARRAAATLMSKNSSVIWRRLLVTALEDLGIHRLDVLVQIAAAIERRRFGHKSVDEWAIITHLIEVCCAGSRCQAANDLHNLSINAPAYSSQRVALAELNADDLVSIARDASNDLVLRNIAVITMLGSGQAPWTSNRSTVELEVLLSAAFPEVQPEIRALYGWAYRKTRLTLATGSLLLIAANGGQRMLPPAFDDTLPKLNWVEEVPCYALDQYTRVGRRAIRDLTAESATWKAFSKENQLSPVQQQSAAGELIFRLEGAVVTNRSSWDIARTIGGQSATVGCHLLPELVGEGRSIISAELPLLDVLRARRIAEVC